MLAIEVLKFWSYWTAGGAEGWEVLEVLGLWRCWSYEGAGVMEVLEVPKILEILFWRC